MKLTSFIPAMTMLLLVACSQPPSDSGTQGTDNTPMPAAEHAQMADQAKPAAGDVAEPAKAASATGTVETVDAAAGKITIAHGPVDALGWPAMKMGFKATPEQIASVQAGQKVRFEFQAQDMEATITTIESAE